MKHDIMGFSLTMNQIVKVNLTSNLKIATILENMHCKTHFFLGKITLVIIIIPQFGFNDLKNR